MKRSKKIGLTTFGVFVALFLAWIVYINLPKQDPSVTTLIQTSAESQEDLEVETEVKKLPFTIGVAYSPSYLISVGGLEKFHPFDIRKYQRIHDALLKDDILTAQQTRSPAPITRDNLLLIHTESYLEELKIRSKVAAYLEAPLLNLAPVSLDESVLKPFRHASGGTILAARQALISGIGVNIGGGYHHAKPSKGEGFCLYADVPIAIRRLQKEGLIKRAVVVDVDVHQGNGTILCLDNDDQTFTFSMHQGNIYPTPKERGDLDVQLNSGMDDQQYMKVLNKHLPEVLDQANADICFIVGGCDTLQGDPLASLNMTHQGIVNRDQAIIDACIERNLPVVLTLSGGYSKDAWKSQYLSIKSLIERQGLDQQTRIENQP